MSDEQLGLGGSFDAPRPGERARRQPDRVAVCDLTPGGTIRGVYLLSGRETRTTTSLRGRRSRTCRTAGYARYAGRKRASSKKCNKSSLTNA